MRDTDFVEFRQVRKTYDGETLAVADLDLAIGRGEFLSLLGPSGSGKTTALMMLAGFEEPTGGEIRLGGRSLARTPAWQRNMGVVFQSYALFPHLTVAENIAFPLRIRRVPGAEVDRQVDASMALVQLSGLGKRRPSELSGGQQQRVSQCSPENRQPRPTGAARLEGPALPGARLPRGRSPAGVSLGNGR